MKTEVLLPFMVVESQQMVVLMALLELGAVVRTLAVRFRYMGVLSPQLAANGQLVLVEAFFQVIITTMEAPPSSSPVAQSLQQADLKPPASAVATIWQDFPVSAFPVAQS